LAHKYNKDAKYYNPIMYISVGVTKITKYLKKHPEWIEKHFPMDRLENIRNYHDVPNLWKKGGCYYVAWFDHGVPDYAKKINKIEEAVAEYIFMLNGLYVKDSLYIILRRLIKQFYKYFIKGIPIKERPIPETEQINSMLNYSLFKLASEYFERPFRYKQVNNVWLKFAVSINRVIMIKYLKENPAELKKLLGEHNNIADPVFINMTKIIEDGNYFNVTWMGYGGPKTYKQFKTIEEAAAECLFLTYGIY